MAREGSIAPKERVNITFKSAIGEAGKDIELPLKLMVLGDFTQRTNDRKVELRKAISIDNRNFDDVLAKQGLNLALNVPNCLEDTEEPLDFSIQLNFRSMADFNPAHLVEQVPELKKLMELRDALVALKGPLGNVPAFRRAIEDLLADPHARARVLGEVDLLASPRHDA